MATTERTTVSSEMIAIGTPYCTERLIVPTSRVTRVTRSPVLALSTRAERQAQDRADDELARGRQQVLAEERRGALREEGEGGLRQHHPDDHEGELAERASGALDGGVDQLAEQARHHEPGAGGERVEHDENGEGPCGGATAGRGRRPAPRGCPRPASPAPGCARRSRRPRRAAGGGRGAARRRASRSRREPRRRRDAAPAGRPGGRWCGRARCRGRSRAGRSSTRPPRPRRPCARITTSR